MNRTLKFLLISFGCVMGFSSAVIAANHTIPIMVITPNPSAVTLSPTEQASVQYTVTNNTNNGKHPQTLQTLTITPAYDVTNKEAKSAIHLLNNNCENIKLLPGQSCNFQLSITGSENLPEKFTLSPRVCAYNGAVCSQPSENNRVLVTLATTALPMVAVGYYDDGSDSRPLIAISQDKGNTWFYSLSAALPPTTNNRGILNAASCSGTLCIGAGQTYGPNSPLLALSQSGGSDWSYPSSILNPQTTPGPLTTGLFTDGSCSGDLCIAVGQYTAGGILRPLLALTQDRGDSWTFPTDVTQNSLPSDFIQGSLSGASCSGMICIAAGSYNQLVLERPLLALSQNGGNSWTYPPAITNPNTTPPIQVNGRALLGGSSCSGSLCVAVGVYILSALERPLLALSQNGGNTWTFPASITQDNLPSDFIAGRLRAVDCDGNTCVAVGTYNGPTMPLLAFTQNGGTTWAYPTSITQNLPSDFVNGEFDSITCSNAVCVAAGDYLNGSVRVPLVAVSHNSGASWTYTLQSLPSDFLDDFGKASASCSGTICIVTGSYTNTSNVDEPFLALSQNSGITWTYPASIRNPDLPNYEEGEFLSSADVASIMKKPTWFKGHEKHFFESKLRSKN